MTCKCTKFVSITLFPLRFAWKTTNLTAFVVFESFVQIPSLSIPIFEATDLICAKISTDKHVVLSTKPICDITIHHSVLVFKSQF